MIKHVISELERDNGFLDMFECRALNGYMIFLFCHVQHKFNDRRYTQDDTENLFDLKGYIRRWLHRQDISHYSESLRLCTLSHAISDHTGKKIGRA